MTTTTTKPETALRGQLEQADVLRQQLAAERALVAVQREDEWTQRAGAARHRIAIADVDEHAAAADRARRERARDAKEADDLARLYRRATNSGTRAQIRAQIQGSAEMRALRVAKVRTVSLLAGIPVLTAFAAWSTTGVQAGVVRLLNLVTDSAAWCASWGMEPALITIVALIIIGRAVLRNSGGDTDWRATVAEWSALGLSLALNIFGGWPQGADWHGITTALPHSIGPLGCAGTAFLIGLFDSYVNKARPWEGAPRLEELDLVVPSAVHAVATVGPTGPGDVLTYPPLSSGPSLSSAEDRPRVVPSAGQDSVGDRTADRGNNSVPSHPEDSTGQDSPQVAPQPVPCPEDRQGQDKRTAVRPRTEGRRAVPARPRPARTGQTRQPAAPMLALPSGDETAEVADLLPVGRQVAADLAAAGAVLSRPALLAEFRRRQIPISTTRAAVLTRVLKAEQTTGQDSPQVVPQPLSPTADSRGQDSQDRPDNAVGLTGDNAQDSVAVIDPTHQDSTEDNTTGGAR